MLYYAASMGGQSASAIQAAKDLAKLNGNTAMLSLALIRFGRFDEVLQIDAEPNGEINMSMYTFAKGYASLKEGNIESAKATLDSLWELTNTTTARFRFHDGKDIVGTMAGILEGEIAWIEGNMEAAVDSFKKATEFYENLNYDEPEPLPFSPRHWLGAAYLEIGAYSNALIQYEKDLSEHPHNIWGLWGAKESLSNLDRTDLSIDDDFDNTKSTSDIWLPSTKL